MFGLYAATLRKNQYCIIYSRHIQLSSHLKKAIPKKCFCGEDATKKQKSWFFRKIDLIFGKYLFLTNTIGSGILMSAGDIIQQYIEYVTDGKHQDGYDWKRNRKFGIDQILYLSTFTISYFSSHGNSRYGHGPGRTLFLSISGLQVTGK